MPWNMLVKLGELRTRDLRRAGGDLTCVLLLALAYPAAAQDQAKVTAGMKVWQDAGCSSCHGTFAEGGGGGEQPVGPSLRKTRLAREAIEETIKCGRPGTQMPYNLRGAYTRVACFGMPLGAVPAEVAGRGQLTPDDVGALGEYLMARIVGKGTVTKVECVQYYGDANHRVCAPLR